MKKLAIGVFGATGRMGKEVISLIEKDRDCEYTQKSFDVLIDFSSPAGMKKAIELSLKKKSALVTGTTGIGKFEKKLLKNASRQIPIIWAPNMSIGIVLVKKMLGYFNKLEGFDFQVIEKHHRQKKDKPSGTAATLQNLLDVITERKNPKVLSVRGGGIFGEHEILAMSDEEIIKLEHTALSRGVFARGAIQASKWLVKQKPGIYELEEIYLKANESAK